MCQEVRCFCSRLQAALGQKGRHQGGLDEVCLTPDGLQKSDDLRDLIVCSKFVNDFGSATQTMRIIDLFALLVFSKKFRPPQVSTFATLSPQ